MPRAVAKGGNGDGNNPNYPSTKANPSRGGSGNEPKR